MKIASVGRLLVSLTDHQVRYHAYRAALQFIATPEHDCPICGFKGRFVASGETMRFGSGCPQCHSFERHRLLALAVRRNLVSFTDADVLHFAPDGFTSELIEKGGARSHMTCDIRPGRANVVLNIEKLELADNSFDRVVCSHVLEHVDDRAALGELYRVLRPGGIAVLMVPIVEGWVQSYEDPSITSEQQRAIHFGQRDHVRVYGSDFRNRVAEAGFHLDEVTANGQDSAHYGLLRGEKVFLAKKPERSH